MWIVDGDSPTMRRPRSILKSGCMRILGIDPGLNTTGYGVLDFAAGSRGSSRPASSAARQGVARRAGAGDSRRRGRRDRVAEAGSAGDRRALLPLRPADDRDPHGPRPRRDRAGRRPGRHRGRDYPATQVKKTITGNGHAAKWQMQEAIRRELNLPTDARAARRRRRPGHRPVPLLSEPACRSGSAISGLADSRH